MLNKLKGLFSIEEFRVSSIVFILFLFSGFALNQYRITGEITQNITTIILYGIGAIAGVNGVNIISNGINQFLNTNKTITSTYTTTNTNNTDSGNSENNNI